MVKFLDFDIQNYNDIPGKINETQCQQITDIAKSIPKGSTVIEIGCAFGRSTWAWMQGLPAGTRLISIDPFEDDKHKATESAKQIERATSDELVSVIKFWQQNTCYHTVTKVLNKHPRRSLIDYTLYQGTSDEFDLLEINKLACVYIDGNHTYEFVKRDLEKYGSISEIICGDDYKPLDTPSPHKPLLGVVKAVGEYGQKTNRKLWVDLDSAFWTLLKNYN